MAVAEKETPTGISDADLSGVTVPDKLIVARWLEGKAGWEEGRPFYSRKIRDLSFADKLALARDEEADRSWEVRERKRVRRDPAYFITQYGSVQPEDGEPIPFDLWPEQVGVLEVMIENRKVILLKARQLGLTWLALHYAVWLMAFCPDTPKARVLVLSKKGTDAQDLLDRARKILARLPAYLRPAESKKTRDSNWRMVIAGRGAEMRSLMGTAEAARSFTATLLILDEFGFYRNNYAGPTWTASQPTLRQRGRVVVISTGNGEVGDGGAFAQLWRQAKSGSDLAHVFLPYDVDPERRVEGWRERERRNYLTSEDFEQEFPETEDQAFAGTGAFKVYPRAGIDAALNLGRLLEARLPDLVDASGYEWGIDWGDFQTFAVFLVELPGGGAFVFDELVLPHTEPGKAAEQIIYRNPAGIPGARVPFSAADQAPAGNNRTFSRILREAHNAQPDRFPRRHSTVPFGVYKEGGGEREGVNTVAYVKSLLEAAEDFRGEPDDAFGVLAISPRCDTLAAQMRNLERDAETGKVRKPALDPRRLEQGDHGPDALVAAMARRAEKWRASKKD